MNEAIIPISSVLPQNVEPAPPHIADFRHLVTGGGWRQLSPDIIARFDDMAKGKTTHHYQGNMVVKRSALGLVFVYLCKMFGSPLVAGQADDARVDVNVFQKDDGICWQRIFYFNGKKPVTVSSLKVVHPRHGLMERVGGGLHMKLDVYEEDGNLHFVSNRYLLKLGKWFIPLPSLLTPGRLHVAHIDEGNGRFRFRMSFDHRYWGRSFYQDGVFSNVGEPK